VFDVNGIAVLVTGVLPGKSLDDAVGVAVFVGSAKNSKAVNAPKATVMGLISNALSANSKPKTLKQISIANIILDTVNANCTNMNANSSPTITGGVLAVCVAILLRVFDEDDIALPAVADAAFVPPLPIL